MMSGADLTAVSACWVKTFRDYGISTRHLSYPSQRPRDLIPKKCAACECGGERELLVFQGGFILI